MVIAQILLYIFIFIFYLSLGKKVINILKIPIKSQGEEILYSFALASYFIGMLIVALGYLKLIYWWLIIILSVIILFFVYKDFIRFIKIIINIIVQFAINIKISNIKKYPLESLLIIFIIAEILLFFLVSIAPEIEFDSLWYHLEQGKTYILEHSIGYYPVPSNLAPNTTMPRLVDLNYAYLMCYKISEVLPKLFHLTLLFMGASTIYLFAKRFFNYRVAQLSTIILFISHPIQWLAHTSYIDFGSLFFGSLSFYTFYEWFISKDKGYLKLSAIFTGLALCVKLWNIILLPLYSIFIIYKKRFKDLLLFNFYSLIIVSPFFIEALFQTGNPIYPIFTLSDTEHLSGANSPKEYLLKVHPQTFLQVIYNDYLLKGVFLILFPIVLFIKDTYKKYLPILIWSLLFLFLWSYIAVHEIRYGLMGILPIIILCAYSLESINKINRYLKFISLIIFISYITLTLVVYYQLNDKLLPPPITQAARYDLLNKEFNTNMWTYVSDKEISKIINSNDKALVFVHNMFYIDFPYYDGLRLSSKFNDYRLQDELLSYLQLEGFTHLYFKGIYNIKESLFNMMPNVLFDNNWINNHFTLVFSNDNGPVSIYKINY